MNIKTQPVAILILQNFLNIYVTPTVHEYKK